MIIHFVCIGNTYRSRLAEAYFHSVSVSGWEACSSGVCTERNYGVVLCWYTKNILDEQHLTTKECWTQTTVENLRQSDRAVFMHQECLDLWQQKSDYMPGAYEVWDIMDMPGDDVDSERAMRDEYIRARVMKEARETFRKICERVDALFNG